jgi:sulfoxide reductase heme-binding subunit YedZ
VLIGGIIPLIWLLYRLINNQLGADPVALLQNQIGLIALLFVFAAMSCRPAKIMLGWTWPMRVRRMFGVFGFFYALLHFVTYVVFYQGLDFGAILNDVVNRNFILFGFLALVLLTPLAITSTNKSVKLLGYVRWQRLHWLVYPAGALAALHFILKMKRDISQPLVYALFLALILLVRLIVFLAKRYGPSSDRSAGLRAERA